MNVFAESLRDISGRHHLLQYEINYGMILFEKHGKKVLTIDKTKMIPAIQTDNEEEREVGCNITSCMPFSTLKK